MTLTNVLPVTSNSIIYPDSDGEPMSDNTEQWRLIVWIKENLELLYHHDPNVLVVGDLLWYPVEEDNKIKQAPDIMVIFGVPKGYRGSYKQWEEPNQIAPQVAFEIWSPGNRAGKMSQKFDFYQLYGVEEYYLYYPQDKELIGWTRQNNVLRAIPNLSGWVSPRLQIRFETPETGLEIYKPDGQPFLSFVEVSQNLQRVTDQLEERTQELAKEKQEKENLANQLEQAQAQLKKILQRLPEKGINPDELL